jgi:hypothetical protein
MKTLFYLIVCLSLVALLAQPAIAAPQIVQPQVVTPIFLPIISVGDGTIPPPDDEWTAAEKASIKSIVTGSGILEKLGDDEDTTTTETVTQTIDGEDYWLDVENHYKVQNQTDLLYLGSNDDVIWPGALIEGDQAHDFVYTPITIPRAPLMLSVNLENVSCAGELTQEVIDPNLANMREGIRLLLQEARKDCEIIPAQAQFQQTQVYTESHLNLALGANINYSAINLKSKFNWTDTTKKNKIISKYQQVLYEVNINTPITQADFFDPARTTVPEIGAAMPPGTNPMYVAGVKYGMMALMFFETNSSEELLNTAMDLAVSKGLTATITGTLTVKDVLDSSNIEIVVYGGSTAGLETIYTGTDGFYNVIKASVNGGPDSPGVPLVYKFRNFSDNNLALITFTSDYSFSSNRFPVYPKIRVALEYFKLLESNEWFYNAVTEMRIIINAKNRSSSSDPGTVLVSDHSIGHQGLVIDMDVGERWPAETDPPLPPYDIIYDNLHDPFYWNYAWLSIKGSVTEIDVPPIDPNDHAETLITWVTGADILEGATLNVDNLPERVYKFFVQDGNNFKMECSVIITLMNP